VLSVREAEVLAREWARGSVSSAGNVSRETTAAKEDPNLLEAESQLRGLFGTKVRIVKNKDRGRIEIEFYSEDDLERLLLLLSGG